MDTYEEEYYFGKKWKEENWNNSISGKAAANQNSASFLSQKTDLFFMDMAKQNVWNSNECKVNCYKVQQHEHRKA